MIIDDTHRLAFVHIPKCAGTSVISMLRKYDTVGEAFRVGVVLHPQMGKVDMAHLPLSTLRSYYPIEYKKIAAYRTFAVIRDPYRRFSSSLYQRLKMYGEKHVKQISRNDINIEIDRTIATLLSSSSSLPHNYIHFQQQCSYVFDEGRQVVKHIYTMDEIPALLRKVETIVGEAIQVAEFIKAPHEQQAVLYRLGLLRYGSSVNIPGFSWLAHRLMRSSFKDVLRNLIYASMEERHQGIFDSQYVREFIESYYADDISLYEEVLKKSQS